MQSKAMRLIKLILVVVLGFTVGCSGAKQADAQSPQGLDESTPDEDAVEVDIHAEVSAFILAKCPHAAEVTPDKLLNLLRGVPESFGVDPRPNSLEWMIREAQRISGN